MRLNKSELALAFQVSTNTIGNWVCRGCPLASAGRPGKAAVFNWKAVENWCYAYKLPPNYLEPDYWIGTAYQRAKKIVAARRKTPRRGIANNDE